MTGRIALAVVVCVSVGWAAPATQPAAPATGPSATNRKSTTPAEVWDKLESKRAELDKLAKVAYFDLDEPIVEKPAAFTLLGEGSTVTVHSLIERLHKARDDHDLRAVLITFGETDFNLAQAQEIRWALDELGRAGKRTFVYADSYDTHTYIAASGATDICMLGGGDVMIPGVGIETLFAKGLFDKVGVTADYIQIGEYKGADEEYTRTGPSDELRGELNKLTQGIYNQLVEGISTHRKLPVDKVKEIIDQCIISGSSAKERGLVDHLVDVDDLRGLVKEQLGQEINLLHDYGEPAREHLDFSNPFALLSLLSHKPEASGKPVIALVHVDGLIVDGEADESLMGDSDSVGGEDLRKALRTASRDPEVKAIVLRIDSPGGSALASEVVWQAARHAAEKKPLIVSVGSMAASGGYYIASAGDVIFADPSAIVGSIGVVGGKFVYKDLFEKLGLHTAAFSQGSNADLFSSSQPFTDHQRAMVTGWMKQTYDQFTQRVMTYRQGKIKDIDQVARGRVFVAEEAKKLGMVDEIGGIEDALAYAAKESELAPGEYEVRVVPQPRTLVDLISGDDAGPESRSPLRGKVSMDAGGLVGMLPGSMRGMVLEQLEVARMLQQRPVLLVAPFRITVK